MLLTYFVTVDLVTLPKITALLRRFILHASQYIRHRRDGKIIKMKRLHELHVKAQAMRLFEENYGYSVIAKKLVVV